jgi:hypothetical protein
MFAKRNFRFPSPARVLFELQRLEKIHLHSQDSFIMKLFRSTPYGRSRYEALQSRRKRLEQALSSRLRSHDLRSL